MYSIANRIGLLFFTLGCCWRAWLCWHYQPNDHMVSDAQRHFDNGQSFLNPEYLNGFDPIPYQAYVFFIQTLTGGDTNALAIAAGLLSVITACCFFRAALAWRIDRSVAIWFAVVVAWMPSLAIIHHFYMIESLMLFFTAVALWASGNAWHCNTRLSFFVAVTLWSVAALTKLTVAPAGAVLLFLIWLRSDNRAHTFVIGLVVAAALVLPNAIRSERILGFYAPFGTATLMQKVYRKANTEHIDYEREGRFVYFTAPSIYSYPFAPFSDWQKSLSGGRTVSVEITPETERQDWKNAADKISVTLPERIASTCENALMFLFDKSWPDTTATWPGVFNYWLRWIWFPLILFVFVGFVLQLRSTRKIPAPVVTATVCLVLFLLLQQTAVMEGRFRKAVEPLLILSAFMLYQWLRDRYRKNQSHPS